MNQSSGLPLDLHYDNFFYHVLDQNLKNNLSSSIDEERVDKDVKEGESKKDRKTDGES